MTEDYLHYIWKFGKIDISNLTTTEGESVTIQKVGLHNRNAGPDFLESKIQIGSTTWAGSVEIHINSSDWDKHKHQFDAAYDNTILHVVYEHDKEIFNSKKNAIPTLVLSDKIDFDAYFYYERFLANKTPLACSSRFEELPSFVVNAALTNALFERLEAKSQKVHALLEQLKGDWDEVFHVFLFRYFGMKVNGDAMEELALRLPLKLVQKVSADVFQQEALFYGQAGMLKQEHSDTYYLELKKEYLYLKQKFQLTEMELVNWKYSKLRPPNFPTIRIGQLASITASSQRLFQIIRDKLSVADIRLILDVAPNVYWKSHYVFGKESKPRKNTKLGESLLMNIVINVIAPLSFAYGKSIGNEDFVNYSYELLQDHKAEVNNITKIWKGLQVEMKTAFDSQGGIQLYNQMCITKKCLHCKIGVHLLNH